MQKFFPTIQRWFQVQQAKHPMKHNCMKIRYAQISGNMFFFFFPKEELNCKGEPCGEKIQNGDINHDAFHETASNNLDKKCSQERFTFLCNLDQTQKDSNSLWKGYIF